MDLTFDSDTDPECRDLYINQATAEGIAALVVDVVPFADIVPVVALVCSPVHTVCASPRRSRNCANSAKCSSTSTASMHTSC